MNKHISVRRIGVGIVCIATALVASGCGDDSEPASSSKDEAATTTTSTDTSTTEASTTETSPPEIENEDDGKSFVATIKNGQPVGGPQVWRAAKGDKVRIVVTSDTTDELHLHEPYDISKDVEAGGSGTLEFVADISGSTELELEEAGVLIGNLEVR